MRNKIKSAFTAHKWNAARRGVDFQFSFDEWVGWWKTQLGPDWVKKRGCRRGQYVMARYYDDGPYATYNVKCVLAGNNNSESWKYKGRKDGRPSGKAKLTAEQVTDIYLQLKKSSRGTARLARQYSVDKVTIKDIRRKVTWRHITDTLD